jgi:poly-gamma-glutamate capsule biosynthesis protein CapA/YwtB (metallophosphatase superfamily)
LARGPTAALVVALIVLLTLAGDRPEADDSGVSGDRDGGASAAAASPPTGDLVPAASRSTTTTDPPTTTTTAPPRTFTLVATGDVLLHSRLWAQAQADAAAAGKPGRDFAPTLAAIRPVVEGADLAVCHLETPIAPPEGPFAGYPAFSVPPEIVPGLVTTGYDACTTASNHTFDRAGAGVDRTLAALDGAGLAHAGSARTPEEAARITTVGAGPARVALLSYTYGFNGIPYPDGQLWRSNIIDEARILADARRARAAGADVVVVALHWGNEYMHDPNAQQAEMAPRLIASDDVDLLLGHHAHVVQPLENVGGEWVVYGMGNLVATHSTQGDANHEGLMVRFTFTEQGDGSWRATSAEYAPLLMITDGTLRVLDVDATLAAGSAPALTDRLVLARDRTAGIVASRGATTAGLTGLPP